MQHKYPAVQHMPLPVNSKLITFVALIANMKRIILLVALGLMTFFKASADEGMWLPQLLQSMNEKDMKKMGMKINAADIYNISKGSLKDA